MDIKKVHPVEKLVVVYCVNRRGVHKTIYLRYLILVGKNGESLFIDDPSEEDLARIWARISSTAVHEEIATECPFCQALGKGEA